jgi:hypothetical protein
MTMNDESMGAGQGADPAFPDLASTPASPEQASAMLNALRTDRLNDRVSQDRYLERSEYLRRVIAGEKIAAVDPYGVTMEQKLEREHEEYWTPPTDVAGYGQLPSVSEDPGKDGEWNLAVRKAFVAAGIPKHLAAPILEGMKETTRALEKAAPSVREAKSVSTLEHFRQSWGAEYDKRIAAIEDVLHLMAEADPRIAAIVDNHQWTFVASPAVIDYLDRVAQARA